MGASFRAVDTFLRMEMFYMERQLSRAVVGVTDHVIVDFLLNPMRV